MREIIFPENLKRMIREKGMTYKYLSDQIGTSESAIFQYCNGVHNPTLYILSDIAETLDVSLDELVYGKGK